MMTIKKDEKKKTQSAMKFVGVIPLVASIFIIIIMIGTFTTTIITTTTSQAYAQTNNRKAVSEIIPMPDDTYLDSTICANGEIIQISGYAHVVGRFVRDETGHHLVGHVNFQNVKGVGLTTGNHYTVPNTFNDHANDNLPFDSATSTTQVTSFHLISQGPPQSTPDLTVRALLHVTINANAEFTAQIGNFDVRCR
jgi:hypothetical protein